VPDTDALCGPRDAETILASGHARPQKTGRTYGCKRSDRTRQSPCKQGAVHIWIPDLRCAPSGMTQGSRGEALHHMLFVVPANAGTQGSACQGRPAPVDRTPVLPALPCASRPGTVPPTDANAARALSPPARTAPAAPARRATRAAPGIPARPDRQRPPEKCSTPARCAPAAGTAPGCGSLR